MGNINIAQKSYNELWNLFQDIVPVEYLDHWLTPEEMKELHQTLQIFDGENRVEWNDIKKLLNNNGYNIEEINKKLFDLEINAVRISE